MWELGCKEGWALKNWCFQIVVLVKTLVSPLDSKEIKLPSLLSLQSCLTLCDPIDGSPPGSPVPGLLQARTLEWVAISLSNAWKWRVKGKSPSRVRLLATPWTAAYKAPPSMGFARQVYWRGVPSPSPEIKLVNPKGNQHRTLLGRTYAEAEAPILRPPDEKSWFTGKDPDPEKDGG